MSDAGAACGAAAECESRVCLDGVCALATCSDDVQNQDESDRDCGGRCDACAVSARCNQPGDCSAGVCTAQGCAEGIELCCQPPSCNDDVRNGNEPVVDCGAAPCALCPLASPCTANAQCASNVCVAGICGPLGCSDGARNGTETDEDCGGSDPACARCSVGLGCAADADCTSGLCQDARCCGGNQGDCTRCARRLVPTIDCGTNGPAAQPGCDAFLQCLQDNPTACTSRSNASCTASAAVCDPARFGGNGSPGVVLADSILGTAQCLF